MTFSAPVKPAPQARTPVPTLNRLELRSVAALIAYVAHTQKTGEENVRHVLASAFNVTDVTALLAAQYDEVVRFLVDLRLNEIIN